MYAYVIPRVNVRSHSCYSRRDAVILGRLRIGQIRVTRKYLPTAVADWMRSNRLQLNPHMTEVLRCALWCASARRQGQLPSNPLAVGSDLVLPVRCVRDMASSSTLT